MWSGFVGVGSKFLVVTEYLIECDHQPRGPCHHAMLVSESVLAMPIRLSTLALPVEVTPVGWSVMLYFLSKVVNALLSKSALPPSCLTESTLCVDCCLGMVRSQSSNCVFASVGDTSRCSHVNEVFVQTVNIGYQKPSSDCMFCFPPRSTTMFCRNFVGSGGVASFSLCFAPFLFLPARQEFQMDMRSTCRASSLSDWMWLCCSYTT